MSQGKCASRKTRFVAAAVTLACAPVLWQGSVARAVSDTTLNATFTWEDWGGVNNHPLVNNLINFYDANTSSQLAGPNPPTDSSGEYQLITNDQFETNGTVDIYAVLPASTFAGTAYPNAAAQAANQPFTVQTPTVPVSLYGTGNLNYAINNNTDASKMFEVLQLVNYMNEYYTDVSSYDLALAPINILYNNTIAGSSMGPNTMNLGYNDWGNIDVILHEYGHYVAAQANLQAAPLGLAHGFGQDNISAANGGRNYGAANGSNLAYQEAIATYLEQVTISDGNLNARIPNLPGDAFNSAYDAYNPQNGVSVNPPTDLLFSVNINSLNVTTTEQVLDPDDDEAVPQRAPTSFNSRGFGEGDEMSVMRSLWDFENNTNVEAYARAGQSDKSNFGAEKIFNLMKNVAANKGSFYGFWKTIDSDLATTPADMVLVGLSPTAPTAQGVALLGSTLEQNDIASVPVTTGLVAANQPKITWTEENNGNSQFFKVLIYSQDWKTLVYQSNAIQDMTAAQGANIQLTTNAVLQDNTFYNYVILSDPSLSTQADLNASNYNWYWSGSAQIYVPEPTSIAGLGLASMFLLGRKRRGA
jgi:hypothetical protein